MSHDIQKEIERRNAEIVSRLQTTFGDAVLDKVQNSYARYDLDAITPDLLKARQEGLVFDVSRGPEIPVFLTPDEVLESFEKGVHFRDHYEMVTPEAALKSLQKFTVTSGKHFTSLSPEQQENGKTYFEHQLASVGEMHNRIREYGTHFKVRQQSEPAAPAA